MAISLIRRTRPVIGSVKILVSRLPSKYRIELQQTKYCYYFKEMICNKARGEQKLEI